MPARGSILPSTSSAPTASPSFSLLTCFFSSYLPPFEGLVREGAVLPAHQRLDGAVEALREPGVVLRLRHAAPAGAAPPGEAPEGGCEGVEGGVQPGVAEEDGGEGDHAEEQHEVPRHPPPLHHGHAGAGQWAWGGAGSSQEGMRLRRGLVRAGGVGGRGSLVLVQTPLQSKQQSCNISLDNRCYFLL